MNNAGRSDKVHVTAFSLDKEARLILDRCAPTPKGRGQFMSRLLHEFDVRLQERASKDADYTALMQLYRLPVREEVISEK